jgi:hypothetical protein
MLRRLSSILLLALPAMTARADTKLVNRPGLPIRAEPVEVRLVDGSKMFLAVGEESLDITTRYGKLTVKLADVQRVEFGRRIPPDVLRRIDTAIALLASGDEKKTDAWITLADVKEFAYPTLLRLAGGSDRAVAVKAGHMLDVLRKAYSAERLKMLDRDVIYTESSRIVGRIELAELRTMTPHFGALKLKLNDLASLTLGESDVDEIPVNVQPDPGYLSNFQHLIGQTMYFRVTGAAQGTVWGSDVYTTDSPLAAVAVHAGVVKIGQTGIVKVQILPGQNGYMGTSRNGISTSDYGPYSGSYKVSKVGAKKDD